MLTRDYAETVAKMRRAWWDKNNTTPPDFYLGMEELLLQHGELFTPAAFNKRQYPNARRTRRECFCNAILLAGRYDNLRYAEGLAAGGAVLPVHHAWCIDEYGAVVDPTWRDAAQAEYFGVVADTRAVSRYFDDKENYCSILDGGWDHNRIYKEAGRLEHFGIRVNKALQASAA